MYFIFWPNEKVVHNTGYDHRSTVRRRSLIYLSQWLWEKWKKKKNSALVNRWTAASRVESRWKKTFLIFVLTRLFMRWERHEVSPRASVSMIRMGPVVYRTRSLRVTDLWACSLWRWDTGNVCWCQRWKVINALLSFLFSSRPCRN